MLHKASQEGATADRNIFCPFLKKIALGHTSVSRSQWTAAARLVPNFGHNSLENPTLHSFESCLITIDEEEGRRERLKDKVKAISHCLSEIGRLAQPPVEPELDWIDWNCKNSLRPPVVFAWM